jgi:SagB-type dehydrogenase family enzyme
MNLNPLMKIENLGENKCLVKLLIDKKKYEINQDLFLCFLDNFEENDSLDELRDKILKSFKTDEYLVTEFLNKLKDKKILIDDLQNYPTNQIKYWQDNKWLTALIYHLESQNISCNDDGTEKGEDKKIYVFDNANSNKIWKKYKNCASIKLPDPNYTCFEKIPFEEVLLRRNSFAPFRRKPIVLDELSNILSASNQDLYKIRSKLENSNRALYNSSFTALETYVFVFSVTGIEQGLYHYDPKNHTLDLIKEGNFKDQITECIGQRRASSGGCLFLLAGDVSRYMERYKHERAYRNLLINVAEFAQQYIFYSTALEYSTFITPAIKDDYARDLIGLTDNIELPLYTVAIG